MFCTLCHFVQIAITNFKTVLGRRVIGCSNKKRTADTKKGRYVRCNTNGVLSNSLTRETKTINKKLQLYRVQTLTFVPFENNYYSPKAKYIKAPQLFSTRFFVKECEQVIYNRYRAIAVKNWRYPAL